MVMGTLSLGPQSSPSAVDPIFWPILDRAVSWRAKIATIRMAMKNPPPIYALPMRDPLPTYASANRARLIVVPGLLIAAIAGVDRASKPYESARVWRRSLWICLRTCEIARISAWTISRSTLLPLRYSPCSAGSPKGQPCGSLLSHGLAVVAMTSSVFTVWEAVSLLPSPSPMIPVTRLGDSTFTPNRRPGLSPRS
jgi:hypothetical protein